MACLACGQDSEAVPSVHQNAGRFPPGFKIETFRWNGSVPDGGLIDVRNPYGGFRSRTSVDDSVMVTAQIQKLSPDQPEVEFVIKEHEGGLLVAVGQAASQLDTLGDGPQDGYPGRIDLTVLLPPNCRLKAQTVDGDMKIDQLFHDVEATSRDGNISLVTRGRVRATTRAGNLDIWLGGKAWTEPQALRTESGKIVVELLEFADLAVEARSSGEIRTEFPEELASRIERRKNALSVALGDADTALQVQSGTGIVELRAVKRLTAL